MSRAFIFPGQGSQYVGMGKALGEAHSAAREVFQEVDDALGLSLSAIMFEGPEDDLQLTQNTQPALMAVSVAVMRVIAAQGKEMSELADYVAGHSLGEYSALCAAGAIGLSDTARLLRLRGEAMQKAVPVGAGAMAAVLGLEWDEVKAICADAGQDVSVANDNAPGQVVISGTKAGVEKAAEMAKEAGAKRALLLPVSAPFHCALMQPAADAMRDALAGTEISVPVLPLIANVTADVVSNPDQIRDLLVQQVTGVVRWRESVARMGALGVDTLVEVGAGKVLSGLARRIDRDMAAISIESPETIDDFLTSL